MYGGSLTLQGMPLLVTVSVTEAAGSQGKSLLLDGAARRAAAEDQFRPLFLLRKSANSKQAFQHSVQGMRR
jgi:hypothetical protein